MIHTWSYPASVTMYHGGVHNAGAYGLEGGGGGGGTYFPSGMCVPPAHQIFGLSQMAAQSAQMAAQSAQMAPQAVNGPGTMRRFGRSGWRIR